MNTAGKRKSELLPKSFDSSEFLQLLSTELTGPLEHLLRSKKEAGAVQQVVETAVSTTLDRISTGEHLRVMKLRSPRVQQLKHAAPVEAPVPLPIEDLKPTAVIDHGLVEMSLSQLYRATEQGRFYCSMPRGRSHGKLYPAWQFVGPVPDMLPEVLRVLQEQGETYVHARMVSQEDELNELSPAEVLAGRPFCARAILEPQQAALLNLPIPERLALVKALFGQPSREHAIG